MPDRPYSEYAERNGGPILEVLRIEFAASTAVLEIGSGTGQHAARFASALPHLQWQASDRDDIDLVWWTEDSTPNNVLLPLTLDVLTDADPIGAWDAVFSANTAHIMSLVAVQKMFALVGRLLGDGGVFCLYGPFRQGGTFNTESNAAFDRNLRSRNPEMGIRDLESLDEFGARQCLVRTRLYTMPANNHMAVWIKRSA
jgi:SAM-dependent methyltransferase